MPNTRGVTICNISLQAHKLCTITPYGLHAYLTWRVSSEPGVPMYNLLCQAHASGTMTAHGYAEMARAWNTVCHARVPGALGVALCNISLQAQVLYKYALLFISKLDVARACVKPTRLVQLRFMAMSCVARAWYARDAYLAHVVLKFIIFRSRHSNSV